MFYRTCKNRFVHNVILKNWDEPHCWCHCDLLVLFIIDNTGVFLNHFRRTLSCFWAGKRQTYMYNSKALKLLFKNCIPSLFLRLDGESVRQQRMASTGSSLRKSVYICLYILCWDYDSLLYICIYVCVYIYIYIYIYTHTLDALVSEEGDLIVNLCGRWSECGNISLSIYAFSFSSRSVDICVTVNIIWLVLASL